MKFLSLKYAVKYANSTIETVKKSCWGYWPILKDNKDL